MSEGFNLLKATSPVEEETGASMAGGRNRTSNSRKGGAPVTVGRRDSARSALLAWPEIRAQLRSGDRWALFLDFDGTLVRLRNRPGDVTMPLGVRRVLRRLVQNSNVFVAIVSGRKLEVLRDMVGVEGIRYFGLHGGERDAAPAALSQESALALECARYTARVQLGALPGIWIEDKGLTFSVHHRDAKAATSETARATLLNFLSPWKSSLHVLQGSKVWEVLPREIPGKHVAVQDVLSGLPASTVVIYAGDDGTDEPAFVALGNQITIRVGCTRHTETRARYCLAAPPEMLRFLTRLERELR
ncbi:MAG TPA: trehalose-phosphatase [Candidatus Acidoferrales bacterium]|jgi:trehalose-phosphatase|nr:trehalose-phosphatase [Candidatus Acidoferrales bacterium]